MKNIIRRSRVLLAVLLMIFTFSQSVSSVSNTPSEPVPAAMNFMDDLLVPLSDFLAPLDELITSGGIFSPKNNPYGFRYFYDIGINRKLEDTPFIVAFFMDDDESSWTQESVSKFYHKLVTPSVDFLEKSAAEYNVNLDFQVGHVATYEHPDTPVKYNGIVEPNRDTSASRDIVDQAAAALGYSSKEEMHARFQEISGQEEIIYVFLLNKAGQTHASIYGNSSAAVNYEGQLFEFCVIYTGFEEGVENVGSEAVAHEILHLYGAEDYYTPEERAVVASMFCPNDIMLCAQSDIRNYEVGELTAYSVGWFNIVPAAFDSIA